MRTEFRLALLISQIQFKEFPRALQDPFTGIARDFDPNVQSAPEQMISQLALPDQHMFVILATDRAIVRVENPEDDDEAVAKSLAAWDKLQHRLQLGEIRRFSIRALLLADRSDLKFESLVSRWRSAWPSQPFAAEAINWALVTVYPGQRRRLFFGPAISGHMRESFTLEVKERVFYQADVDHLVAENATFTGTVRRHEFALSLRDSRDYAQQVLAAVEERWPATEDPSGA